MSADRFPDRNSLVSQVTTPSFNSVGRASSYPGSFRVWNLPRRPATEQPSTPSSRRAGKVGTYPASSEPTRCLLHHGCGRQERPQSRSVRKRDGSGCRSADRGYCVSRSEKCDTRQVRLVDSTPGRRRALHLSLTNRIVERSLCCETQ